MSAQEENVVYLRDGSIYVSSEFEDSIVSLLNGEFSDIGVVFSKSETTLQYIRRVAFANVSNGNITFGYKIVFSISDHTKVCGIQAFITLCASRSSGKSGTFAEIVHITSFNLDDTERLIKSSSEVIKMAIKSKQCERYASMKDEASKLSSSSSISSGVKKQEKKPQISSIDLDSAIDSFFNMPSDDASNSIESIASLKKEEPKQEKKMSKQDIIRKMMQER